MDVNEVLKKYTRKIEEEMNTFNSISVNEEIISKDYTQFKDDLMPELSRYEKWAKQIGGIVRLKLASKDYERIKKLLNISHLDLDPGEVVGLSLISFIGVFFLGIMIGLATWFLNGGPGVADFPTLFVILMFATSIFLFYYFYTMPERLAAKWRLKASSQMVPAILYTVIYMKHTSNLERAISFVSQHVEAPLSLDLKKVIWDVETGRYSSVKQSLDSYLEFWKDSNIEFVESFHLIESSLYEPNEGRRLQILERALRVILDEVYEKMLKYTHSIKSPLTNVYMLGIVLPTLALALLPLASALLGGVIQSSHVFVLFNLLIPFFVFYLTIQIMLNRPGGYGESSLLERNPLYYQYVDKKPYYIAAAVSVPFLILGLVPYIFQLGFFQQWTGLKGDYSFKELGITFLGNGDIFGFQEVSGVGTVGPFGMGALLFSLFIPFSIALFFALSYAWRTKELVKARDETKALEGEFNSSLFTLGNRLGDGTPAEIAFAKVAESTRGQKTSDFFRIVNVNIQTMGMGIEDAIFNNRRGALVYYPSALIATSMRIMIESVKKGLNVAAESLMSISEYVRNIQKINERLRDLLAEVVSDMKSNMTFLAPLLAGIVIGLASMITQILSQLKTMTDMGETGGEIPGIGNIGSITQLFDVVNMIPPYFMQIAIGLYIIEIIFILTETLVIIDAGEDRLKQTNEIAINLLRGGLLYLITAGITIIALSVLAGVALGGLLG